MSVLQGQSVAVIGGTSGICAAIAEAAAADGAIVTRAGRGAIDILSEEPVRAFFATLGPVDHLVVTAATVKPRPFKAGDTASGAGPAPLKTPYATGVVLDIDGGGMLV
jgi:NAD(P)-dependent dehydrogenase (short-subunit alcohol dehydrogenase family)